ncbi:hypothetical protein F2Q69_00029534 [Brassica cretica]|uniref:Uncharacterized protein n=2 Tax=Brassica cretica TaxID=69181 RepID=A0A8S9S9G4_BRACR|nr:hypothetical protein F2Q69_00029534 [Brassica cretica]
MSSKRINDQGIIAPCHCGAEYETDYSASIETHTTTSIDCGHQKSTDTPQEESVVSSPDDSENDYYNPTIAAYTRQHMHTEEYDEDYEDERATESAPSIDIPGSPSIDTQPPQRNRKRTSTDIANYSSIDAEVNRVREGDYSIGSWGDDHHHESYAVETTIYESGADELHEDTAWGRTRYTHPIDRAPRPSIDINPSTSIDVDVPTSVDRQPEFCRRDFDSHGTRKFYWEEKDEYGVYRDEQGYARDIDGNTILLHNMDIRRVLERASRDEPSYKCLPEHANVLTQTKLVPEIYTKDEINEMFYGVCGEQEKNKEAFQMKLDGVYYPLNDSISWLTICMEEMKQDIARIQHATDVARSSSINKDQHTSINNRMPTSVDDNPPRPHKMKSQENFHTREEIDQLVEEIYRALETTEERLDGRCDDIYFPMDLSISALTSKIEAMQGELVEIQSYITRRPEASS